MAPGDLGSELERLPGVLAATVFDDPRGPRVYIATTAESDRATLREATAAILADRGLRPDAERIHIAAPPDGASPTGRRAEPPAPARGHAGAPSSPETRHPRHQDTAPADPRFTLEGVDVHRSHGRAECTVRLRLGGRSSAGAARESDTGAGRARAAARAALAAVETLDPALRLGLHGIRRVDLFGHGAIVVLVEATAGRSHEHLPGSALLDRSEEEAAALATINALREWME